MAVRAGDPAPAGAGRWRHLRRAAIRLRGFTLIELMITLAIFSILAAISYPTYRNHVAKTRRADAKMVLLEMINRQSTFRANFMTFTPVVAATANCAGRACGLGLASNITPEGDYVLTVVPGPTGIATSYVARATPRAGTPQAGDKCGTLTMDQADTRGILNAHEGVTVEDCW